MTISFKPALSLLLLLSVNCFSQNNLTVPVNLQATYLNGTRTVSGAPGKNYWQNSADYDIKINFNPQNRLLQGIVAVDYVNNSPDTLNEIDFKLYPNLYKKGSIRNMPVNNDDINDGVQIKQVSVNSQDLDPKQFTIDGTNMVVKISPLAQKHSIHLNITYSYVVNKSSHIRTGQVDSGAFFMAYTFPRIAVYDDIDGWNRHHYEGIQEFYNDFCHFKVDITVPGNYQVWATGTLKNAEDVYSEKFVKRLNEATLNDRVTNIITPEDLKNGDITINPATNTWKFDADSITDFARVRVDAVFNPQHQSYFEVINYARKTISAMSYNFPKWPYPFPHETVFDGLDQMEYPMMVNDAPYEKPEDDIELTDHEIFHSMFPFYMGINETKYAWMDEGVPDQAITKVNVVAKKLYSVTITNIGTKPVPVDLTIFYTDGKTQLIHQNISCWKNGNKTVTVPFTAKKRVQKLVLGNGYDADVDKSNNTWIEK
eukprot:gene5035-5084_t